MRGFATVQWDMTYYSGDNSQYDLKDDNGNIVLELQVGNDRSLKVYDGTSYSSVLTTLAAGETIKLKIVFDTTANTASIYLNGSGTAAWTGGFLYSRKS
jgi:hypothetical protein